MAYNLAKPSILLAPYVKHYWEFDALLPEHQTHVQRIVPCGLAEIIFYLDKGTVSSDERNLSVEGALVSGQQNDFYDLKLSGSIKLFAIYFHPHGLSRFLNLPLNELFNQSVPLRDILKDKVDVLEGQLAEAPSFEHRIEVAERFMQNAIYHSEKKEGLDRIFHTMHLINGLRGNTDVNFLSSEACFSRKQYERHFSKIVGTSPKQFLKIVRFQNAVHQKSVDANCNMTELAYKCGYFDQAHMISDFKTLTGYTPKQYFNFCEPFSDYFE